MLRTVAWIAFWLLVVLWIVHHPTQASNDVHGAGHFIASLVG